MSPSINIFVMLGRYYASGPENFYLSKGIRLYKWLHYKSVRITLWLEITLRAWWYIGDPLFQLSCKSKDIFKNVQSSLFCDDQTFVRCLNFRTEWFTVTILKTRYKYCTPHQAWFYTKKQKKIKIDTRHCTHSYIAFFSYFLFLPWFSMYRVSMTRCGVLHEFD